MADKGSQDRAASVAPAAPVGELEALLIEEGLITEQQLERARRVSAKMRQPRPVVEILVELGQLARSEHDRVLRRHRANLSLAEILRDDGALDENGIAAYEETRRALPQKTERELLVEPGLVTEQQFLKAFASKSGIPYTEPETSLIDEELIAQASMPYLLRNKVLPLRIVDGGLRVFLTDPEDTTLIAELERIYSAPVKPCLATAAKILESLRMLQELRDPQAETNATTLQYREIGDAEDEEEGGEGAVRVVDYLLSKAIELGASDLHVEPLDNRLRVRARVDGSLRAVTELPAEFTPRVISRLKVLAGADISERRLHQDGRIFVKFDRREVDIRVSSYVSMYGETLVMRLLDRQRGLIPLDSLGFEANVLALLREIVLRTSSGLVLVTGPTGSGKTSTLYSFVDSVNDESLKVITCEDPVEYVLESVTQCSVNEKTGPTFADSLKSILRQDPDVIVVGEVRNAKTANLAVEAALTGHKVFSTFHTEDSVGAIVRLLEMGVEPFLVASTLTCVVAQRLVRRLCPECRTPGKPSAKDLRFLGLKAGDLQRFPVLEGAGCAACDESGYRGRLGIHEVLQPDDDFRDAILRRASSRELRELARKLPRYLSLQEDGLLKVLGGATSLCEIVENAPRDVEARPLAELQKIATKRSSS